MAFDLCQSFQELAFRTFDIINEARRMSFKIGEESFTDFNLFHLKRYHPNEVRIKAFNRIEEGVVGADWEWWFTDGGRWIGFRVQAKIVDVSDDHFPHLHYHPKNSIPQCEKLIMQANATPYRCIPLYCLYLSTKEDLSVRYSGPDLYRHGCSVLSAYEVRGLRATGENQLAQLWPFLKPWHRLVCFESGLGLVDHVDRFARSYFLNGGESNDQLWTNDPPPYAAEIYAGNEKVGFANNEAKPLDLAGVMVIGNKRLH